MYIKITPPSRPRVGLSAAAGIELFMETSTSTGVIAERVALTEQAYDLLIAEARYHAAEKFLHRVEYALRLDTTKFPELRQKRDRDLIAQFYDLFERVVERQRRAGENQ